MKIIEIGQLCFNPSNMRESDGTRDYRSGQRLMPSLEIIYQVSGKAALGLKNALSRDPSPASEASSVHLFLIHTAFRNIHAILKLCS